MSTPTPLQRLRARLRAQAPTVPANTPLPPSVVARGLRLSTIEGALANVHVNITTGAFLTGFALLLGANDFQLGLIGALPFVGQLCQFLGAYLEERLGARRALASWTAGISRALWAVMAALPFVTWLGGAQFGLFLLLTVISQALLGISANAWLSWMSDLVPPRQRGRYFGTRNTITSITAMLASFLAGRAIDHYEAINNEQLGYLLIFGMAVICSTASAIVLSRQPEPPMQRRQRTNLLGLLQVPLRHARFRTFALAATGWTLATGVASPFFNAYGIQHLQLSFQTLALFSVVTSGVSLLTQPFIGRFQDRYGDRVVMLVSVIGTVLLPWGWILSTPTFTLPVWLTNIFSGVFWPGINQGLTNVLMDRAPPEGRGAYMASYGALTGLGTFLASLLGGLLATAFAGIVLQFGPVTLINYSILFIITSLGRAAMAAIFAKYL